MGILKVKVGTSWVDIGAGAAEEVFVGPDDPIVTLPTTELWYDTDDSTPVLQTGLPSGLEADRPVAPTVPMQWFSIDTKRLWTWDGTQWTRFGWLYRQALTTPFNTAASHSTFQAEGLQITVNEPVARLWKITYTSAFYSPGGANGVGMNLQRNGVLIGEASIPDTATSTSAALMFSYSTYFVTTGGTGIVYRTLIAARNQDAQVSSWASATAQRSLVIEDLGPI